MKQRLSFNQHSPQANAIVVKCFVPHKISVYQTLLIAIKWLLNSVSISHVLVISSGTDEYKAFKQKILQKKI